MILARRASVGLVVLAAVAVSASAFDYKSYNERKCTATNSRCAGAPGKPYVHYAPCCDKSMTCSPMPYATADQWGRYCLPAVKSYSYSAPKCYKAGERCMGAPGKPYVEYAACCDKSMTCSAKAGDWGGFCQPSTSYTPPGDYYGKVTPTPPTYPSNGYDGKDYYGKVTPTPPTYPSNGYNGKDVYGKDTYGKETYGKDTYGKDTHGKCYKTGERCMGEKGYPYVTYKACCKYAESCIKSTTTWGSFCGVPPTPYKPTKDYYGKDGYGKDTYGDDYHGKHYYVTTKPPTTPKQYYGKDGYGKDGYGKKKGKKDAPKPPGLYGAFPGLPTDFGCNSGSEPAAADNVASPFSPTDEQAVIELSLPIAACDTTVATFTQADASALCTAILGKISSVDSTAECRFTSVVAAGAGRQMAGDDDLDVSARQLGGVIVVIQILTSEVLFTAILLLLGEIIVVLGGFFSALPIQSGDAN